jgi:hypothetical protein
MVLSRIFACNGRTNRGFCCMRTLHTHGTISKVNAVVYLLHKTHYIEDF